VATNKDEQAGTAIGQYPASLVLILYCFGMVWFVGGLSCFHLWLMGRNVTTYEHFRHRYSNTGNPYSLGMWKNFGQVLCTNVPPRWEPLWEKQRAEDEAIAAEESARQQQMQSQQSEQQQLDNGHGGDGGGVDSGVSFLPDYHDGSIIGGSPTASSYALHDGYDTDDSIGSEIGEDNGHVVVVVEKVSGGGDNGGGDIELGVLPIEKDAPDDFSTPTQTPRNGVLPPPLQPEEAVAAEGPDIAALEQLLQSPRPPGAAATSSEEREEEGKIE
jgi:hypothetical protein